MPSFKFEVIFELNYLLSIKNGSKSYKKPAESTCYTFQTKYCKKINNK